MFGKVVFGQKQGFPKMGGAPFFGGGSGLGDCYCMMLLDALEGCSENPTKYFFEHPLVRCRKQKNKPKKRPKKVHPFLGGP